MIDKNIIQLIKLDYTKQLQEIFPDHTYAVRNLDKVQDCNIVYKNLVGLHASTDWKTNTITYGPYADECDIYHELDHIRKGEVIYRVGSGIGVIGWLRNEKGLLEAYPQRSQAGLFFEEAITDYMAMHMFKNSRYFDPSIDQSKLDNRKFYSTQLEILKLTAKKLGIHEMELCNLIDLKHHKDGDYEINDLFKQKSNGMVDFDEFETRLDFWAFWQKLSLICSSGQLVNDNNEPAVGMSEKHTKTIQQLLSEANFMLEQIKPQETTMGI